MTPDPSIGPRPNGRRALVTGATGFIGSRLTSRLVAEGWRVRALVRNPRRARRLPEGVEPWVGDLRLPGTLLQIAEDVEVVFHLGAAMRGDWTAHRRATVEGTVALLQEARNSAVRHFIHVSSVIAFETSGLRDGTVVDETWPLATPETAHGPYARGKVEAERAVWNFVSRHGGPPVTIVRPGLVYGPGRLMFEHLGVTFGPLLIGYGRGSMRLPLTHVDSVVEALLQIAERPQLAGRVFLVVDDDQVTRRQYLAYLRRHAGRRYVAIYLPVSLVGLAFDTLNRIRHLPGLSALPRTSSAKLRSRALSVRYSSAALADATAWRPSRRLPEALAESASDSEEDPTASAPAAFADAGEAIRVGLIGAGSIFDYHATALRKIQGIEITGVLDVSAERAATAAARHGISRAFTDLDAFYRECAPDVVHVLTPPHTHARLVLDALDRGVHVVCEKPLATTSAACGEIVERARVRGLTVGVDHNFLFDPRVRAALDVAEAGRLGDVLHVDVTWAFDLRRLRHRVADLAGRSHWVFRLPGGLLEDLAAHPVSIALAVVGPECRVSYARSHCTGKVAPDMDDELRLGLESGGTTGHVTLSLGFKPDDVIITIYGSHATVRVDVQNMLYDYRRMGAGPRALARASMVGRGAVRTLGQLAGNAFRVAVGRTEPPGSVTPFLSRHYAALRGHAPLPVPPEDAAHVVRVLRTLWPERREHTLFAAEAAPSRAEPPSP